MKKKRKQPKTICWTKTQHKRVSAWLKANTPIKKKGVPLVWVLLLAFSFSLTDAFVFTALSSGLSPLVEAIIEVESGGNRLVMNERSHAIGLMQITPVVLKEYNRVNGRDIKGVDLFDPNINVMIGYWYLDRIKNRYLKEKFTIERLLACYNGGYDKLKSVGFNVNKMPKETRDYIRKVIKIWKKN